MRPEDSTAVGQPVEIVAMRDLEAERPTSELGLRFKIGLWSQEEAAALEATLGPLAALEAV